MCITLKLVAVAGDALKPLSNKDASMERRHECEASLLEAAVFLLVSH